MDMQDVSNLVIPEGEVRTIHDKDNRLLWSKIAYSVEYSGDTFQQTYSGKNLFSSVIEVGGITASGYLSNSTTRARSRTKVAVQPNTEYTLSMIPKDAAKTINMTVQGWESDDTFISQITGSSWVTVPVTFTTPANCTQITISGRYSDDTSFGTLGAETDVFQNIQLELGSSPTSYEPYTGGPAPNPDYPQPIQVVTGGQTVTIGDGDTSQTFTVDLGSIELCKIGTYQDYIYKSEGEWYVHRETDKRVYSSSSGWNLGGAYGGYQGFYAGQYAMVVGRDTPIYTNYFKQVPYVAASQTPPTEECFMINANSSNSTMIFYSKIITSLSELNDYFSATPMSFYFPLKTPVDTQITDAALISQLNAVHEWLTRYGYSSTAAGDLSIIIDKTSL